MAAIPQALRTKLDANQALMERLGSQATPNIFFQGRQRQASFRRPSFCPSCLASFAPLVGFSASHAASSELGIVI